MKIELQEPFKSLWRKGYVVTNKQLRNHVCLFNCSKDRTTISLARYKMCCKLGYILEAIYEVDHIDNDKTNDNIDNLQVLTKEQNRNKETSNYWLKSKYSKFTELTCSQCNTIFNKETKEVRHLLRVKPGRTFCCSRLCSDNSLRK